MNPFNCAYTLSYGNAGTTCSSSTTANKSMNIFVLDEDASAAARYHCDKHVVKMIVESAQMLSTAHRLAGGEPPDNIYRTSYPNHPCTNWARESVQNYCWLHKLAVALCHQYRIRYRKTHGAEPMLLGPLDSIPPDITKVEQTPFTQVMPFPYQVKGDPVQAYRLYYIGAKMHFAQWRVVSKPHWLDEAYAEFDRRGLQYASSRDPYAFRE